MDIADERAVTLIKDGEGNVICKIVGAVTDEQLEAILDDIEGGCNG